MLRQYVPHPAYSIFCLCGPGQMIVETTQLLQQMGVSAGQIRSEQFDLTAAAAILTPSGTHVAPVSTRSHASAAESRQIRFAASGCTSVVPVSQTLLEAAEAEGIPLASSCRAGLCQACRTRLLEGEVECRSDVLDPDDRAAGYILPCVSWAITDCVVEA